MIVKILGAIDVFLGGILLLNFVQSFPERVLFVFGLILLVKAGFGMFKDFASWVDCAGAIVFFLSIVFSLPTFVLFVVGILILQKGAFSFF